MSSIIIILEPFKTSSHVLLRLNRVLQRVPIYVEANTGYHDTLFIFFKMVYFSKYVYTAVIEHHSTRAHRMHDTALEKSAVVETLTCLNLAHGT